MTKNWSIGKKANRYNLQRTELRSQPQTPSKKTYDAQPNNNQFVTYNENHAVSVSRSDYSQHRQQDIGRAIALKKDPKRSFYRRVGADNWVFNKVGKFWQLEYWTVVWSGIGTPQGGLTIDSSYSQGFDYYDLDNIFQYHVDGQPDCYTWAVWFMVNGIPSDELWIPTPSRNPGWTFAPGWVEY